MTLLAKTDFDVVVVGGGLAGLSAAFNLPNLEVAVVEAEPIFGGRAQTTEVAGFTWNKGAQVVLDRNGPTARLADQLGVGLRRIDKQGIPLWMSGHLIYAHSQAGLFAALPLSVADKLALARVMASVWFRYSGALQRPPDPADRIQQKLDSQRLDVFVEARSEPSRKLWNALARNATSLDAVSVAAFQPLANLLHLTSVEYAVVGGTAELVNSLVARLSSRPENRMIVGSAATSVSKNGEGVDVVLADGKSLRGRYVILATPCDITLRIVADLPSWKQAALAAVDYAEDASVAFSLSCPVGNFLPRGVWRLPVVGQAMIGLCDASHSSHPDAARNGRGMIRGYTGHDTARLLRSMNDAERKALLLRDLDQILPGAAAFCTEVQLAFWRRADSPWRVGRLKHIEALAQGVGRYNFCGDYVDPSGMNGAIKTGFAAAARTLAASEAEAVAHE